MYDVVRSILQSKGSEIHSVSPDATVTEAVRFMDSKRIGGVLVMSDGRPVGMFTERDLMRRVVALERDPRTTRIADVMTREVVAVRPDISIDDAMAIVSQRRCRHLPVTDGGHLVGMITSGDLVHWRERDREMHIEQLANFITGKYPA